MDTIVLKFGGSSVSDNDKLKLGDKVYITDNSGIQ